MVLTRQERKDLVLDLYNQGRTYREIAEEARMSPRDIGTIVNNAAKEKKWRKLKNIKIPILLTRKTRRTAFNFVNTSL